MSVRAITWAFDQKVATLGAKLVLIKLGDHADEEGVCWPSVATLAEQCGISERAVQYNLRYLEQHGFITRTHRFNGELQTSNLYKLIGVQYLHRGVKPTSPVGVKPTSPKPSVQNHQLKKESAFALPADLKGLESEWLEWLRYRKNRRLPMTPETYAKQIKFLQRVGVEVGKASIELAISCSWQGLFEPKRNGPKPPRQISEGFRDIT